MNAPDATARLCIACGLCCNGVLFRDVELQAADDVARLKALGLPVKHSSTTRQSHVPQPCVGLCPDNRCKMYSDRPARCREFECGLLKEVIANELDVEDALTTIRQTIRKADRVKALLWQLGNRDKHRPLGERFRRTCRIVESTELSEELGERFAELTLAVHDLNLLTHSRFYTCEESVEF